MIKKFLVSFIFLALCFSMVGCSGVSKGCNEIKKIQDNVSNQNSAHLVISSNVKSDNRNENMSSEFIYKFNDTGTMEYCQTQMDSSNKLIFCEVNNGEKAEQWLLGNGWAVVDPTSYNKENPHQYVGLLTNKLDKKIIKKISKEEQDTNTVINVEIDEKELNSTVYKDSEMEMVSQNISYNVNKQGNLICYNDNAVILDKQTNIESQYNLEVQLSEHNAVTEIKKPELRANAVAKKSDK